MLRHGCRSIAVLLAMLALLNACYIPVRVPAPTQVVNLDPAPPVSLSSPTAESFSAPTPSPPALMAAPSQTAPAPPLPTATQLPPLETETLVPTQAAAETLAPEDDPNQPAPLLRARVNTNCRAGPSTNYDVVALLFTGVQVPVFGRDASGTFWYVQHPRNPGQRCWAWMDSTEIVEGNPDLLPVTEP